MFVDDKSGRMKKTSSSSSFVLDMPVIITVQVEIAFSGFCLDISGKRKREERIIIRSMEIDKLIKASLQTSVLDSH